MRRLNRLRMFAYAGLSSLLLVYIILWMNMIADPRIRSGSDFMGFYSFGRISQTRGFQHLYDLEEQKAVQEQVVGVQVAPIFYTHLPFIAPLAVLLVNENYVASFCRWAVILLSLNFLNVLLLINLLEPGGFEKEPLAILGVGAFLFFPTFSGFMNGQDTQIMLLGAVIWVSAALSGKYLLSGIGLSLTTIRPQLALILALPFLFRHRNVFWGFVSGSLVLAGISLLLVKVDGASKFIESIRYIEATVWRDPHALDMPTISGFLRRNFQFEDPGPVRTFVWICYVSGIAAFSLMFHRSAEIDEKHLGLLSLASIFLLPYAHYHDLIILLIPIFCLIRILSKGNLVGTYHLAVVPLTVSLLAILGFAGSGFMKFPIVFAIMLGLGGLLLGTNKIFRSRGRASAI